MLRPDLTVGEIRALADNQSWNTVVNEVQMVHTHIIKVTPMYVTWEEDGVKRKRVHEKAQIYFPSTAEEVVQWRRKNMLQSLLRSSRRDWDKVPTDLLTQVYQLVRGAE